MQSKNLGFVMCENCFEGQQNKSWKFDLKQAFIILYQLFEMTIPDALNPGLRHFCFKHVICFALNCIIKLYRFH